MTVSMYTVSIPVFIQHLNGLNTVLDKAAAWAAARKVNEADLLNMRLSPDMFPLVRQVRAATDHAANAAARLSGKELLKFANDETTLAQLKDRIAKTIEFLKGVKQSEIDGTEIEELEPDALVARRTWSTPIASCFATCSRVGYVGTASATKRQSSSAMTVRPVNLRVRPITSASVLAKFSRTTIASAPESFNWCSSSRGV